MTQIIATSTRTNSSRRRAHTHMADTVTLVGIEEEGEELRPRLTRLEAARIICRDENTRRAPGICLVGVLFVVVWIVPCAGCKGHEGLDTCAAILCLWPIWLGGISLWCIVCVYGARDLRAYYRAVIERQLAREDSSIELVTTGDEEEEEL